MPRFEVELAASHGIWNKVGSQQARTGRANRNRPDSGIVRLAPWTGPLDLACGSWLTSRKSTRSDAVASIAKRERQPLVVITEHVSLIGQAYACDDRSTNNEGQGGDRPNTGRGVFVLVSLLLVAPFYLGS